MPAGPEPHPFIYFAAAKYAGYTAFSRWAIEPRLPRIEEESPSIPTSLESGRGADADRSRGRCDRGVWILGDTLLFSTWNHRQFLIFFLSGPSANRWMVAAAELGL